jgi:small subunit ribosomal protein S1
MENMNEKLDDAMSMENIARSGPDYIKPNTVLQGEVVTIDNEFAYVNVGTKSDGRVSLEEFEAAPRVGDIIDIMLKHRRMVDGMYIFSREDAEKEKGWRRFLDHHREGAGYITGVVRESVARGMVIDCDGVHAFLPFSHAADMKTRRESGDGALYTFKIMNVDEKKRTVLLSRREYLNGERERAWNSLLENYKPGDRIKGRVTRFVDFGAFVDVGGIEGLLHRNEISWRRVFKKKNYVKVGDEREFVILDINRNEGKISLGLKQLAEDPWLRINEKYRTGDVASGRVLTVLSHGVFIELEEGVEGFLESSEISWTKKSPQVKDLYHKGQTLQVVVTAVNHEERKLLLGVKQLSANPWDTVAERFPVGSVHRRPVKKVVSFGLFVEIEKDIDGLIHLSDLSWDEGNKNSASAYTVNDEVEFKILDIRKEEMRISCGIKQLTKSPWEYIKEKYPPRTRLTGKVSGVVPFGVFVKLDGDVEGLVHVTELSRKKVENVAELFKVGDPVGVTVLGVDPDRKRLSLSIKQHDMAVEKEELNKVLKNTSPSKVTIGDLIKMKQGV